MTSEIVTHWIGGAERPSFGQTAPVFDPALGQEQRRVALADTDDVEAAIRAAADAFPGWSATPIGRRQPILFRFRDLLSERRDELAQIITREHGKVLSDALGEISRGLEVVEFATGIGTHLMGLHSDLVSTDIDVHSLRQPIGVTAIISPFNFPAMVPAWFFPIAIATGNTVVLKPSEKAPSAANWIARLWQEAGLPDGVFNVLHGGREAVEGLLDHPEVASVSFVGSTPIAKAVYERGTSNGKRVQALGGAKNHMLVLPDADLDLVADSAVSAGFGSAGERCMAISVVVAVESIADDLVARIADRIEGIQVGDGRDEPDMGPLITREHRDRVAGLIDAAERDGAQVVADGRGLAVEGRPEGFWLGPTLLDRVPLDSAAYREEIFGPVLAVIRVASFSEGLEVINGSPFGNGTAIFTNDGGAARRFAREVQAGMVGVNVPIPVPAATHSFGGWKASMFGDLKAHGDEGVRFFTKMKTVTTRWLDPSHGGIDLGFPQQR